MRLIDADALIKAFEDCTGDCACCIHNTNDFDYCGLIDDAPTVKNEYMRGYEAAMRESIKDHKESGYAKKM